MNLILIQDGLSKLPLNPSSISKVVNEIKLKLYHPEIRKIEKPNILIAVVEQANTLLGLCSF